MSWRDYQRELNDDDVTSRRTIYVVSDEPMELPPIPRDWRMVVAATCVLVCMVAVLVALITKVGR